MMTVDPDLFFDTWFPDYPTLFSQIPPVRSQRQGGGRIGAGGQQQRSPIRIDYYEDRCKAPAATEETSSEGKQKDIIPHGQPGYYVVCDLPGLQKDEVNVSIDDNRVLTIEIDRVKGGPESGASPIEAGSETGGRIRYHLRERENNFVPGSSIHRVLQLPKDADDKNIHAKLANGVLTVFVPKKKAQEQEQTRKVTVQ